VFYVEQHPVVLRDQSTPHSEYARPVHSISNSISLGGSQACQCLTRKSLC